MLPQRTARGRQELQPGVRTLPQRHRSVLLVADGRTPIEKLSALFDGQGAQITRELVRDGFLEVLRPAPPPSAHPAASPAAADSFDGRRSLATTRMFLFDICERMFVRRDADRAEHFRESLRQATDRESMLSVAHQMMMEVERLAGADRAASIRERIAMLLPVQAAKT